MKILFSALLLTCLLNTAWAGPLTTEQLRSNLITNTWRETDANEWTGFGLMMEFNDNGIVTVINNTRAEWPAMARYTWTVDLQRETPVISFRDYTGSTFRYSAVQTLRGLDLLPFDSEMRTVIHLSTGNRVNPVQWTKIQQTLFGSWENTIAVPAANSQVPQLRFNPDGTYALSWGVINTTAKVREAGRWILSKCSDFIILMPEDSDTLEYAKVRLISADEMVVEQLVVTKGSLVVNKEVKNMFFNKL